MIKDKLLRANHWLEAKSKGLWRYRTRVTGAMAFAAGYVQAHQAELNLFLPAAWLKYSLMIAGAVVFGIGAYNDFVLKHHDEPPAPP